MPLKRKLIQAGVQSAARAAASPKAFALAGQAAPFLRTGFTGAVLGGATRGRSIHAVEEVAEIGMGPLV